jgi:hypothetical protein
MYGCSPVASRRRFVSVLREPQVDRGYRIPTSRAAVLRALHARRPLAAGGPLLERPSRDPESSSGCRRVEERCRIHTVRLRSRTRSDGSADTVQCRGSPTVETRSRPSARCRERSKTLARPSRKTRENGLFFRVFGFRGGESRRIGGVRSRGRGDAKPRKDPKNFALQNATAKTAGHRNPLFLSVFCASSAFRTCFPVASRFVRHWQTPLETCSSRPASCSLRPCLDVRP